MAWLLSADCAELMDAVLADLRLEGNGRDMLDALIAPYLDQVRGQPHPDLWHGPETATEYEQLELETEAEHGE